MELESHDTTKLVSPAQAGDPTAQERLLDRIDSQVRKQAAGFQLAADDRDDFFQEVMRRVHEKLHTLRQAVTFRGWVRAIGNRVFQDIWRGRRARAGQMPATDAGEIAESATDMHRRLQRRELRELVNRFDEPRRTIFLLHLDEDLNYREIARRLREHPIDGLDADAISEGAVRYQLTKGIDDLKWILRADFSASTGKRS